MALYPMIEMTVNQDGLYQVPNNNIAYFPLVLQQGTPIKLFMQQTVWDPLRLPQERSIRCWISQFPGGDQVVNYPPPLAYWHLSRFAPYLVNLVDPTATAPQVGFSISLTPGAYCLNLLNLANEKNSFALLIS